MEITEVRRSRITVALALLMGLAVFRAVSADNGFDTANAIIPPDRIESGGPPRDGIPSIDEPVFEAAEKATWLRDEDRVLGIDISGNARAYPIRILNWHEIVNDRVAGQSIVVTFCPLCGTGMVFSAEVDGRRLEFGVSGLLYNSDMLLYDRATDSLWSQIMSQAVAGELAGTRLKGLPVMHTSWSAWQGLNPDTLVLSTETGHARDYDVQPYRGYAESGQVMFRPAHWPPPDYHPKEVVAGIEVDGKFRAYPFSELEDHGKASFEDKLNNRELFVSWDAKGRSVVITRSDGQIIPVVQGFWFAWYAFHPNTSVFEAR